MVIANLKTLTPELAQRWGLDLDQALRHAEAAARQSGALASLWPQVYQRAMGADERDVDEDLYGGFIGNEDRRKLQRLRALPPALLAGKHPAFADARLAELLFRYRARNFPESLHPAERARWQAHCAARLQGEASGGPLGLELFLQRVTALEQGAGDRSRALLAQLRAYALSLAPHAAA